MTSGFKFTKSDRMMVAKSMKPQQAAGYIKDAYTDIIDLIDVRTKAKRDLES